MTPESNRDESETFSPEYIENLLRQLQPRPSPRFYLRIKKAPWQSRSTAWLLRRFGLAAAALGMILILGLLLSPPLRTLARQWILFFLPDAQDQMELSIEQLDAQELYHYATPENFPYSVVQLSDLAGYPVSQPALLLPGMQLVGGRYELETLTTVLLYQGAGYNLFLSQRPIEAGQEYFSIGASAIVESVSVGDIQGEYVAGGWVKRSGLPSTEPDSTTELYIQWDKALPQYTLRWQIQDFAYQLRSTGITSPQKDELITLAQTIR